MAIEPLLIHFICIPYLGCGRGDAPGVYARVSKIYQWAWTTICANSLNLVEGDCGPDFMTSLTATLPPSLAPTLSPTTYASSLGALRMELLPDNHGQEISLTLTRIGADGSTEVLQYIEAGMITESDYAQRFMFVYQDLPKDSSFELKLGDLGGNGICCNSGTGEILVFELDNMTGEEKSQILSNKGDYGAEWVTTFTFPSVAT
jgi:hypothetical protein